VKTRICTSPALGKGAAVAEFRKVRSPKLSPRPGDDGGKVYKLASAMNGLKVGESLEMSVKDACAAGFVGTTIRAVSKKQFRRIKIEGKIYVARVS
jgi:hypothetical protein